MTSEPTGPDRDPEAERGPVRKRARRRRETRLSVRVAEVVSRIWITLGGFGTIASVATIFAFLVVVVLPLFGDARTERGTTLTSTAEGARVLHVAVDEYRSMVATLTADGRIEVRRLATGEELVRLEPFDAAALPTSFAMVPGTETVAFGFPDGTVRVATFGFRASFPLEANLGPQVVASVQTGDTIHEGGLLQLTPEGKVRRQDFEFELSDALRTGLPSAVSRLDLTEDEDTTVACALAESGELVLLRIVEEPDFMTGELDFEAEHFELPYAEEGLEPPRFVEVLGRGDAVIAAWGDGSALRWDLRDPDEPVIAERLDLVEDDGRELVTLGALLGKSTVLAGDSEGSIGAWFLTKPEERATETADGALFQRGHLMDGFGAPVVDFGPSSRRRLVAVAYGDGSIRLLHVTSQQFVGSLSVEDPETHAPPATLPAIHDVVITPKEDGLVCATDDGLVSWGIEPGHPEASFATLFRPVWYEGFPEPVHAWQAESATDDFEPKFGFLPLVFGTLKATFYSMLFGAPLALLAAIFTSEFLDRRLRTPIKSTIEMMASLPSVVLGFLAGIVIAPYAQTVIPASLAVFVTLPLALLIGAHLWQLLPAERAVRLSGAPRMLAMAVMALLVGIPAAYLVGPVVESLLFAGDMEQWLAGSVGRAMGGWMILLLPLCALVAALLGGRLTAPLVRARGTSWTRTQAGTFAFVRLMVGIVLALTLALGLSFALELASLDPREPFIPLLGSYLGVYDPRNSLIVGFVMGFAIIPIIYTLSEDALSSVPRALRLASLGAGATQWQTTIRVILPTAMSGIFSAMMIGLGRAVGETMIVLMATGNTPIMEMNLFNGFRTLAANIAYEMPEAVKGSTHYRALFLAGLVLFGMTFVINTVAEVVRLRFRKRAYEL